MNRVDCRNIETQTEKNKNYRKVVKTVEGMQLVLMSLNVGETIPCETHSGKGAQFIRIESGNGKLTANDEQTCRLKAGTSLLIPNGVHHCIANTSKTTPLKLYSVYTPPQHASNHRDIRQPKESHTTTPKKTIRKASNRAKK